jgi:hypothetical protein
MIMPCSAIDYIYLIRQDNHRSIGELFSKCTYGKCQDFLQSVNRRSLVYCSYLARIETSQQIKIVEDMIFILKIFPISLMSA